jgi:hypothetical protein
VSVLFFFQACCLSTFEPVWYDWLDLRPLPHIYIYISICVIVLLFFVHLRFCIFVPHFMMSCLGMKSVSCAQTHPILFLTYCISPCHAVETILFQDRLCNAAPICSQPENAYLVRIFCSISSVCEWWMDGMTNYPIWRLIFDIYFCMRMMILHIIMVIASEGDDDFACVAFE